jgi:diguanylate cyclase (GGDEF)-like protein
VQELQKSHRTSVLTLCAMLLVSLASSGYLLLVSQPAVSHYADAVRDARLMHEAMLDQETGLRGWLATGDPSFLEPTVAGRQQEAEVAQRMLGRSAGDREATADLLPALVAQREWSKWADRASRWRVSDEERNDGELAQFLFRGKERFDNYRAAEEDVTAYLVGRRDQAIDGERVALVTALLATLAMLAAGGVHTRLRRRRLERTLLRPMTQLLTTIRSLRSGDLSARSSSTGVRELDAVGAALDGLADGLREAGELATAREARLALLARRLETVITVARETSGSPNVGYVANSVAAAAADLLDVPTRLWVRDEDGDLRALRSSTDPQGVTPPPGLQATPLVAAVAAEARPEGDVTSRAYPLILGGTVVGVLEAATPFADEDVEHVLAALLSTGAAGLESARLHSSAREQAELDPLTRLPNRRRLEVDLDAEWQRSVRYQRPLAFVMLDLDHFKSLNDTYGHLVGDLVLREAAAALGASLRDSDTAYRYGGEEFALLLRETTLDEAIHVAERLRAAVAAVTVPGYPVTVTTSIGVAQAASGMAEESALVAAADQALYCAKRNGRNRVEDAGGVAASDLRPALTVAG